MQSSLRKAASSLLRAQNDRIFSVVAAPHYYGGCSSTSYSQARSTRLCRSSLHYTTRTSCATILHRLFSNSSSSPSSSTSQQAAQARHETLKSGLRATPPDAALQSTTIISSSSKSPLLSQQQPPDAFYKQRIQTGALQSALAFVTVLIAAQSLHNAHGKRKAQDERDALLRQLQKQQEFWKRVLLFPTDSSSSSNISSSSDEEWRRLAEDCVDEIVPMVWKTNQKRRSWWPWQQQNQKYTSSHLNDEESRQQLIDTVTNLLQSHVRKLVKDAHILPPEEQDKTKLQELLQEQPVVVTTSNGNYHDNDDDKATNELLEQLQQESHGNNALAQTSTGRRTVYTF